METVEVLRKELRSYINPQKAAHYPKFFKAVKGEYGEGDKFLGVVVPDLRKLSRRYKDLSWQGINQLMRSEWHEERMLALLILILQFQKGDEIIKQKIYDFYLSHTEFINNWDLVDVSAKDIVGAYLYDRDRSILYKLVKSSDLWERRISVIASFYFIKKGDFKDIVALSEMLLEDKHDLIHKATGWMLREAGKVNQSVLLDFLDRHHKQMPRTMLRYAIERLTTEQKAYYMIK